MRSIKNKLEEICNICYKLKPDILCLTETWLDASSGPKAFVPEGYNIIRHDRSDDFKQRYGKTDGGGVAVLYKKHLKVRKIINTSALEETLWIEVKGKPNFTVGIIYRASYTDLLTEKEDGTPLEAQMNKIINRNQRVIILGDLNCDTEASKPDASTRTLHDVFDGQSMQQLIKKPTRIDPKKNTKTTIDHIWTMTDSNFVKEAGTVEGVSDHTGIYAIINITQTKPEPEIIRYRCYKSYIPLSFNKDLEQALEDPQLTDLINAEKVNEANDRWMEIFLATADKHAPMIEKKITEKNKYIPWFSKDLQELIKEKSKRLKLYWLDGFFTDLKIVKSLSNKIIHLKRKLKRTYYRDKVDEYSGEPKKMWQILKELTQTETRPQYTEPEFINQNIANHFNNYFATVGTKIQKKLNVEEKEKTNIYTEKFEFKMEEEPTIIKLIDRIRADVAVGSDNISARLLKDSKHTIAKTLTQLVNLSYKKSIFPKCMKHAIVRPIHKKDSTEEPSNYRPLSILSVLSKIFERSAGDQFIKYLEENNLLSETQHAYRKGHSTHTCLSDILNHVYEENDKGNLVGIASLDLSKAFDSICHSHLIEKLREFGLGNGSLSWCDSYLKERTQKTKFKKYTSNEETVTAGVPQGSILGPILFICFTNALARNLPNCKIVSYADDTQILVSAKTTKQIKKSLEKLICSAQSWYTQNSLLNNASKTEVMVISRKKQTEKLYINVTEEGKKKILNAKKSIKVLGIHIDDELNWNKQTNEVNRKAKYAVRNLSRVNHLLPTQAGLLLYNSLVASHLNYVDTVWAGCGSKNKRKLQRTQNMAVKSILGMRKHQSSTEALKKAGLIPLDEKRKVHEGVYAYKALKGKLPAAITRQYQQQQSRMNHRSADKKILTIPKHKTEHYKNSPFYRTITTWNSIPHSIKELDTCSTFKRHYQTHLQKNYTSP